MDFKDYYATLGIAPDAPQDEVKRAYRKLARKYHPDVSKEADAEARFKEIAEAHEALIDPERRAAYDALGREQTPGRPFEPPGRGRGAHSRPGDTREGFDFGADIFSANGEPADAGAHSAFFEALFGRSARAMHAAHAGRGPIEAERGLDEHAELAIDLREAYQGARRSVTLRVAESNTQGHVSMKERRLEVDIPKGMRTGQHLRLAGQGAPGRGGAPAGDLFLKIMIRPDARFRVDGRDVLTTLTLAPWEAALGASVSIATPEGEVELSVPAGAAAGQKLRLKGRGLPGDPPGHLYAVLSLVQPRSDSEAERRAWQDLALAFPDFAPRPEEAHQ